MGGSVVVKRRSFRQAAVRGAEEEKSTPFYATLRILKRLPRPHLRFGGMWFGNNRFTSFR